MSYKFTTSYVIGKDAVAEHKQRPWTSREELDQIGDVTAFGFNTEAERDYFEAGIRVGGGSAIPFEPKPEPEPVYILQHSMMGSWTAHGWGADAPPMQFTQAEHDAYQKGKVPIMGHWERIQ